MRSAFMLVVGLVLGVALGAFGYDYFIAKPDRERAAYELEGQERRMRAFDPLKCSEMRETLLKQVQICIEANEEWSADLKKCQTAQASAGLPIPGKDKNKTQATDKKR